MQNYSSHVLALHCNACVFLMAHAIQRLSTNIQRSAGLEMEVGGQKLGAVQVSMRDQNDDTTSF